MVTGGVSQALDMLCTLLARPGEVVLVESPVYHLALRIFRDHALELVPVPSDDEGLQVDATILGWLLLLVVMDLLLAVAGVLSARSLQEAAR